jgi:cyclic pyranopterin phosphate synthase
MEETMKFLPRAQILTLEEIYTLAKGFSELGVEKIRITGGEPLVRNGILQLIEQISHLSGLKELVMTTNGSQLEKFAKPLRDAGVSRLNISLDTLDTRKFRVLTRNGDLTAVLKGIEAAKKAGFHRLKLNAVILKNRNHIEVIDLVQFAINHELDISFIEEMPLGIVSQHDRYEAFYSSDEIKQDLEQQFTLLSSATKTGGPSNYYQVQGTQTRVGFISPHSHNFCSDCNRVRLTAEGRLLLCLGNEHSMDMKKVLRTHPGNHEILKQSIIEAMKIKPEKHEFVLSDQPVILRHMNVTGG